MDTEGPVVVPVCVCPERVYVPVRGCEVSGARGLCEAGVCVHSGQGLSAAPWVERGREGVPGRERDVAVRVHARVREDGGKAVGDDDMDVAGTRASDRHGVVSSGRREVAEGWGWR